MIFHRDLAVLIALGKKTQTRRPVNSYAPECRYKVGRTYAVQLGRGKPEVGRIRVLDVRSEPVGSITKADAVAEGFKSRAEFVERWTEMYGGLYGRVWVITFEVAA